MGRRVSRSRANVSRGFAAALAVVSLIGQISTFAHVAFTRHLTCAEHGELIEVRSSASATPAVSPPETGSTATTVNSVPAEAVDHGHDHCPFAPYRRQKVVATPTIRVAIGDSSVESHTVFREIGRAHSSIRLIRLAPKNSPPAQS